MSKERCIEFYGEMIPVIDTKTQEYLVENGEKKIAILLQDHIMGEMRREENASALEQFAIFDRYLYGKREEGVVFDIEIMPHVGAAVVGTEDEAFIRNLAEQPYVMQVTKSEPKE